MKTLIPWAPLGGPVLHRATRGDCDCVVLKRRIALAHRETGVWRDEARFWKHQTEKALIREAESR